MWFDASCYSKIVQVCLKRIEYIGTNCFFITIKIIKERYFRLAELPRLDGLSFHANATPGIRHLYNQKNRKITLIFFGVMYRASLTHTPSPHPSKLSLRLVAKKADTNSYLPLMRQCTALGNTRDVSEIG